METVDPADIPLPIDDEPIAVPEAPQTRGAELEEDLTDQLLTDAKDPDARMHELNRRAEETEAQASQLMWPPDAVRVSVPGRDEYFLEPHPLQWTAGRNGLFEALKSADGALGAGDILRTELDARIILFLATHDIAEWSQRRYVKHEGVEITLPPLRNDFTRFLQSIDQWADTWIPLSLSQDAVAKARELLRVHDQTRHTVINAGGAGLGKP